ncbi:MAG: hypothetical protein ACI3XG_06190 [Faecousia sp.]
MELRDILDFIENAEDFEMSEIVKAAVRRNDWLYPELETVFLTLPREDSEQRRRSLESAVDLLMKENL